ncbi:hypothetical protein RS022_08410 [Candidatus Phytoplasma rubi]|uniref:Uncharacterized protein n=1 Tax=Candidatus Phytoplasma rubi TaxID=399025 RepID=A0ABY7BSP6_9MOLU|nr:hypothetical protein [Candidatus Phytoplasma rubi]WAN63639.1 hypothetical protein RS022_08410 [Candidatus Phytoplasma rubi]
MEQRENQEKENRFKSISIFGQQLNSILMQIIVVVLVFHIYKEWDAEKIKKFNISLLFFLKNFIAFHFQIILLNKFWNRLNFVNKNNIISPSDISLLYNRVKNKVLTDEQYQNKLLNELEKDYQKIFKEDTNKLISEFISQTILNQLNNNNEDNDNKDNKNSNNDESNIKDLIENKANNENSNNNESDE